MRPNARTSKVVARINGPLANLARIALAVVVACGCACCERTPLGNGAELVYIDHGIYVVQCPTQSRQLVPPVVGPDGTVDSIARVRNSSKVVCRMTNSARPAWECFFLVSDCASVREFASLSDTNREIESMGLESIRRTDLVDVRAIARGSPF
jgi:hypothetical protein